MSEAESDFSRDSVIVQKPLPVITEEREMDLKCSTLHKDDVCGEDNEKEEKSTFGASVVANPGAIDDN